MSRIQSNVLQPVDYILNVSLPGSLAAAANQSAATCPLPVLPPGVPVRDPPTTILSALQFEMTFHQVFYGQIKSSV